jgi:hypothetical protein
MLLYDPCELNLDDHELQQLANFMRGYRVTDESIEMALQTLFQAGEYELTLSTRERLVKMLPPGTEQLRMIEQ